MNLMEVCGAISATRKSHAPRSVLVSTMSAMFAFDELGDRYRRIDSVPLMGGAVCLALGISLARPDIPVIAVDGDASLLMELGGMVSVASARPAWMIHFVINNAVQFNGAVNMTRPGCSPRCEFAAVASAAGYTRSLTFTSISALQAALPRLLTEPQLAMVELKIEPNAQSIGADRTQPYVPDDQFDRMRNAVPVLRTALSNDHHQSERG